ncbi:MAG: carboxypeptidase-like regulatory domain-containing protein [Planctomycetota bacterium]
MSRRDRALLIVLALLTGVGIFLVMPGFGEDEAFDTTGVARSDVMSEDRETREARRDTVPTRPSEVETAALAGPVFTGRVLDSTGRPMAGAHVRALPDAPAREGVAAGPRALAASVPWSTTDEQGIYRVHATSPAPVLEAWSPHWGIRRLVAVAAHAEAPTIRFPTPRTVAIRIVDGDRRPIAGAEVRLSRDRRTIAIHEADAGGWSRLLTCVNPGSDEFRIELRAPGHLSRWLTSLGVVEDGWEFALSPGIDAPFVVVEAETGDPVSGAVVESVAGRESTTALAMSYSDAAGRGHLALTEDFVQERRVAGGPLFLRARHGDHQSAVREFDVDAIGGPPLVIALPRDARGESLSGLLISAGGLRSARVRLRLSGSSPRGEARFELDCDAEGRFSIDVPEATRRGASWARIEAWGEAADGALVSAETRVALARSAAIDLGEIELLPREDQPVRVHDAFLVRDRSGAPRPDAVLVYENEVHRCDEDGRVGLFDLRKHTTAYDTEFLCPGLVDPQPDRVRFGREFFSPREYIDPGSRAELDDAAKTKVIVMERRRTLSGVLRDLAGRPIAEAAITGVYPGVTAEGGEGACTDARGRFTIDRLPLRDLAVYVDLQTSSGRRRAFLEIPDDVTEAELHTDFDLVTRTVTVRVDASPAWLTPFLRVRVLPIGESTASDRARDILALDPRTWEHQGGRPEPAVQAVDASGRASFAELNRDLWEIRVLYGRKILERRRLTLNPERDDEIRFDVTVPRTIRLRVLANPPVESLKVSVLDGHGVVTRTFLSRSGKTIALTPRPGEAELRLTDRGRPDRPIRAVSLLPSLRDGEHRILDVDMDAEEEK